MCFIGFDIDIFKFLHIFINNFCWVTTSTQSFSEQITDMIILKMITAFLSIPLAFSCNNTGFDMFWMVAGIVWVSVNIAWFLVKAIT